MADADAHGRKIANLCRFCGSSASKKTERPKNKFKDDFERYFGINSEKCSGRLNALVTQEQSTMPVKKVMAVAKHNFIGPIMFGSNLVMHSIARSRMAVDILIYGKLHPGGQYNIMKSWLNGSLLCQKETI